ncbi:unnamed protein product [Calypogeia fissa]
MWDETVLVGVYTKTRGQQPESSQSVFLCTVSSNAKDNLRILGRKAFGRGGAVSRYWQATATDLHDSESDR